MVSLLTKILFLLYKPMAHTRSSRKRILIAERNRLRNQTYKSAVRTLIKKSLLAVENYSKQPTEENLQELQSKISQAYSKIDKAVGKGIIHQNNGDRKKARLAKRMKTALGASTSGA